MESATSLTRDEVREVDRLAIEDLGIPGVVLMENAGRGAAEIAEALLSEAAAAGGARCCVVCGGGNNGGDGYVVARHLALAGIDVVVHEAAPSDQLTGDALTMREIAARMGLHLAPLRDADQLSSAVTAWDEAHLVVDGLLGTGFRGALRPASAAIVEALAAPRRTDGGPRRVLALDLPSGLDADTGHAEGACVRATKTATFFARKRGFDARGSERWTGEVVVKGIGAPATLAERARANVRAR